MLVVFGLNVFKLTHLERGRYVTENCQHSEDIPIALVIFSSDHSDLIIPLHLFM